jgi:GNAT superfamily N-acetyltransferase
VITVRPVRPTDADALARLFEDEGCPCFCRYFHFEGDKNDWLLRCAVERETNRRELEDRLATEHDEARGVIAVSEEGSVLGWLKVAPALAITKAYEQRYYRGLPCFGGDRSRVMLLACALVRRDARKKHIATSLVGAAIDLARSRGAAALEAFPRKPRERVNDEELWTIPVSALTAHGFSEVGGEDPYPVLRFEIDR